MRNSLRAIPILLSLATTAAAAQTTIGETSPPSSSTNCITLADGNRCGQSFTAPVADNVLQSFTFTSISTIGTTEFQLFQMAGNTIVGGPLFSQVVAATGGFVPLTFTPAGGLALTGGAQYAALIFLDTPGEEVTTSAVLPGTYADGAGTFCDGGATPATCGQFATGRLDTRFEATFASSTAPTMVPEPATVALFGGGLFGLLGVARLRGRLG